MSAHPGFWFQEPWLRHPGTASSTTHRVLTEYSLSITKSKIHWMLRSGLIDWVSSSLSASTNDYLDSCLLASGHISKRDSLENVFPYFDKVPAQGETLDFPKFENHPDVRFPKFRHPNFACCLNKLLKLFNGTLHRRTSWRSHRIFKAFRAVKTVLTAPLIWPD